MRTKFFILIYLSIFFSIIASCDYQPTGGEFTQLDSNYTHPDIYLVEPIEIDTILYLSNSNKILRYQIAGDLSKLNKVNIFFNSNLIKSSKQSIDSFNLKLNFDFVLINDLTIQIINNSGTGSLVDQLGLEGSVFERKWTVKVIDPLNFVPDSIRWENIDGTIKLSWNTYYFGEFITYEVWKSISRGLSSPENIKLATINNPNTNYFFDSTYTGEKASYSILYKYKRPKNDPYTNTLYYPVLIKEKEIPKVNVENKGLNKLELKWTKSNYFNNIGSYFFKSQYDNKYDIKIENSAIMSYNFESACGFIDTMKFFVIPKNSIIKTDNYKQPDRYDSVIVINGDYSFQYSEIEDGANDFIYFAQSAYNDKKFKLCKYSKVSQEIEQKSVFETFLYNINRFTVSPSGNNIAIKHLKNLYYSIGGNLSNIQILSDVDLIGKNSNLGFETISISDNGILAVVIDNIVYIYDLINKKLIAKKSLMILDLKISKSGKYIACQFGSIAVRLYKIENGDFVQVFDEIYTVKYNFDNINHNILYYFDYNSKSFNSLDLDLQKSIKIANNVYSPIQISPSLNIVVLGEDTQNFQIRDMKTFQLLKTYKSIDGPGYYNDNFIYFSDGIKCKP